MRETVAQLARRDTLNHLMKCLSTPLAFVVAFLIFGTPSTSFVDSVSLADDSVAYAPCDTSSAH